MSVDQWRTSTKNALEILSRLYGRCNKIAVFCYGLFCYGRFDMESFKAWARGKETSAVFDEGFLLYFRNCHMLWWMWNNLPQVFRARDRRGTFVAICANYSCYICIISSPSLDYVKLEVDVRGDGVGHVQPRRMARGGEWPLFSGSNFGLRMRHYSRQIRLGWSVAY